MISLRIKMIKKVSVFFILLFFISLTITPATRANFKTNVTKALIIPEDQVITKNFYIGSGEVVEINGKIIGDVVVLGSEVTVNGVVDGDLLAFAGNINIKGQVTQDIRVAGGDIKISSHTGKNITVLGGDIYFDNKAKLGGGALIVGGDVNISTQIPGDLTIFSGNVVINNKILGNSEIYAGNISLTENAIIEKDFIYTSENEADISESASISGRIFRQTPRLGSSLAQEEIRAGFNKLRYGFLIISFLSTLIMGFLIIKIIPNVLFKVTEVVEKRPFKSVGLGLLTFFIFPVFSLFLIFTLIGIPLLFYAVLILILLSFLGKIVVYYWLGSKIVDKRANKYITFFVGFFIIFIFGFIKVINFFVGFTVITLGLGAELIYIKALYDKRLKKGAI